MKITLSMLQKEHACSDQVALFKKLFGESVTVTRVLCLKHAADFDWDWAVDELLSSDAGELWEANVDLVTAMTRLEEASEILQDAIAPERPPCDGHRWYG